MTALTGETGAGKTLLVEALGLLLGGRADPSTVRAGAAEALVEGRFVDPAAGEPAGETLLARSVAREGRSKAWVDGRMVPIGALAEVAGDLIELHGQHQHRSLVHSDAQRRALDLFGGIDLSLLGAARQHLRRLSGESEALGGDARQRAREVEMLRYQIDEIEGARIEDGDEDARLEVEEDRLAAADAHRQAAARALSALIGSDDDGALDRLADASAALAGRAPLAAVDARVRSSMGELSDLATELRAVVETWEDDPERLEEIRSRRQLFRQLERKYGSALSDVLSFAGEAHRRLAAIEHEDRRAVALDAEIGLARSALARAESEGAGPADDVTFELAANAGEPLQPLAKVASGGELSRAMLALRLALTDAPGVMVFDEVDAGVGGTAAIAVGAALADLGRHSQVLVVTHLAQVAAQADHQFEVRKSEHAGRTHSLVLPLDNEGRVLELSRMLSGRPDSASARRHARELLDDVRGAGVQE